MFLEGRQVFAVNVKEADVYLGKLKILLLFQNVHEKHWGCIGTLFNLNRVAIHFLISSKFRNQKSSKSEIWPNLSKVKVDFLTPSIIKNLMFNILKTIGRYKLL